MKINCEYKELVPIHKLVPHVRNANRHPQKQIDILAKILDFQGWRHPIIVSKLSGYVVVGHGRLEAAKKLGYTEVPVDYQDFESEAQETAFLFADNKSSALAEHDDAFMIEGIKDLGLDADFDLDLLALPDLVLHDIDPSKEEIEDEVPENVETRAKPGDLWKLGEHRLLCGDATNIQHVEMLMGGEKADMVFTDPPYGVNYKYNSHNDNVTKEQHTQFLKDLISLCQTVCGKLILTPGCYNLDAVFKISNPDHVGCWTKTNAMSPGRVTHFWTWEPIFFYGKWKRKRGNDVFNFPVGKQPDTGNHTCPKPIALWQDIIENFSETKELILDIFGGSGSTLIACEKTNRKCFMMEIDPHYCSVILERWEKYSGKTAELLENSSPT
jgi:16S rRNA G966 N2-methylase RsmD